MFQNTQVNSQPLEISKEVDYCPVCPPLFEQNAQEMIEGFCEEFPPCDDVQKSRCDSPLFAKVVKNLSKKKTSKRRSFLKRLDGINQSYIIKSEPTRGRRLIMIQVIDMEGSKCEPLLSGQYVVTDHIDPIMDQTENIINNISKRISGYSYSF